MSEHEPTTPNPNPDPNADTTPEVDSNPDANPDPNSEVDATPDSCSSFNPTPDDTPTFDSDANSDPDPTPNPDANPDATPNLDADSTSTPGSRRKRWLVALVAVLLVVACGGAALWVLSQQEQSPYDENAQSGQAPYKTAEQRQAESSRQVDEGVFNIAIASTIEFADGASPGVAYIENVPNNHYDMQVTITLNSTDEVIFESKALAPGSYLETITLARKMEAGTYNATASFTALNRETHEKEGRAAAEIELLVLA